MEYLFDTANIEEIRTYSKYIPITGVTSNPSIVKREGKIDFFSHMKEIRSIIGENKSFHIQVTGEDYDTMMADADAILRGVDEQVYVKVPVTLEGLRVIRALKNQGVHVTATAIYTEMQGFFALEAGVDYMAPYYNRMENNNINPELVITAFSKMIKEYGYQTKILAASFKNMGQVNKAILAGAHSATLSVDIIRMAFDNPLIGKAVRDFNGDWAAIYGEETIESLLLS